MNQPDLDRIRGAALDQVDRARRGFYWFFALTCGVEFVLLFTVYMLTDWGDPLHKLLIAVAGLIYLTLGAALLALGAYMNWGMQRLLIAAGKDEAN
ncbi:MAG: hypothetical protein O2816_17405 [Planctomycetota bacterium]|nr:hypothetical protein [Planctomycetota bacterium]